MNINTTVIDSMDIDTLKATLIGALKSDINATLLGVLNGKKLYPTRTERVNSRCEALLPVFLEAAKGGVDNEYLRGVARGRWKDSDVDLLADDLVKDGTITKSGRGRWHLAP